MHSAVELPLPRFIFYQANKVLDTSQFLWLYLSKLTTNNFDVRRTFNRKQATCCLFQSAYHFAQLIEWLQYQYFYLRGYECTWVVNPYLPVSYFIMLFCLRLLNRERIKNHFRFSYSLTQDHLLMVARITWEKHKIVLKTFLC